MTEKKEEEKIEEIKTMNETSPKEKKSFSERFKDNWNRADKHCEHCGMVTEKATGLTHQNIRRLVSFSTNPSDWIILFIIIMVLFGAWAYNRDMAICKEMIKEKESINITALDTMLHPGPTPLIALTVINYSSNQFT